MRAGLGGMEGLSAHRLGGPALFLLEREDTAKQMRGGSQEMRLHVFQHWAARKEDLPQRKVGSHRVSLAPPHSHRPFAHLYFFFLPQT